jgi:hypothetical protein
MVCSERGARPGAVPIAGIDAADEARPYAREIVVKPGEQGGQCRPVFHAAGRVHRFQLQQTGSNSRGTIRRSGISGVSPIKLIMLVRMAPRPPFIDSGDLFPKRRSVRMGFQNVQRHVRNVSDDPAVMWRRRYVKHRTRQQIEKAAILIFDGPVAREHGACVRRVAELGSGRWGIVNRPLPTRLISGAPKRHAGDVNDLKPSKGKFAQLVGLLKAFQQSFRHLLPLQQAKRVHDRTLSYFPPIALGTIGALLATPMDWSRIAGGAIGPQGLVLLDLFGRLGRSSQRRQSVTATAYVFGMRRADVGVLGSARGGGGVPSISVIARLACA